MRARYVLWTHWYFEIEALGCPKRTWALAAWVLAMLTDALSPKPLTL